MNVITTKLGERGVPVKAAKQTELHHFQKKEKTLCYSQLRSHLQLVRCVEPHPQYQLQLLSYQTDKMYRPKLMRSNVLYQRIYRH